MAVKAVIQVTDFEWDASGLTFHCTVVTSSVKHYSVSIGPYAVSGLGVTISEQIEAAAKDYAEASMGETFGLLDTARLLFKVGLA